MIKVALFRGNDPEVGRTVFPLFATSKADSDFEKLAAPTTTSDVSRYVAGLRPLPDSQYVLVNAMGAGEYYGANINADYFPEAALIHRPDRWTGIPGVDKELAKDWPYGFPTFYGAHAFAHHRNKDPLRAYGNVELSVWNPRMKRVELVVRVDKDKCDRFGGTAVWDKLKLGQYLDVSMGCFVAGTRVTLSDGTRKPIEEIQIGDYVLTHLGRSRRVTRTFCREYTGPMYSIRPEAHETIICTEKHPFWAVQSDQVKTGGSWSRWKDDIELSPEWLHACCLTETDVHLLEPVLQETLTPDFADRAFCRLFGYYLAEGHILRNKNNEIVGIQLSTNAADPVHEEIEQLCKEFGTKNPPSTAFSARTEHSASIYIFDERLAQLCYEHGGGCAKKKRLSTEAVRWHPNLQREILGAYANGDGCGTETGALLLSTSSTYLAWQWLLILPRLGILASIQNLEHKAGSGFSAHVTNEWVIHIGKQWAFGLRDVCAKVHPLLTLKTKNSRKIIGNYAVTPIREAMCETTSTTVYNLEVEEDNSFLVAGLAVHNSKVPFDTCAICLDWTEYRKAQATFDPTQHKYVGAAVLAYHKKLKEKNGRGIRGLSITRADYCEHMKKMPNKILPDGRRVFVYNDYPRFFDISFVFIGADKTAKVMWKIASNSKIWTLPGVELAEKLGYVEEEEDLQKVASVDTDVLKLAFLGKAAKLKGAEIEKHGPAPFDGKAVPLLTAQEPSISNDVLDGLCQYSLPSIFSSTAAMGIPLRPREFQRIIIIKMGLRPLAEDLEGKGIVFPHAETEETCPISDAAVLSPIQSLLDSLFDGRSALSPAIDRRITLLIHTNRSPEGKNPSSLPTNLLNKIGSAYCGYRKSLMDYWVQDRQQQLAKAASVLSPASFLYLKNAYWNEVGRL